MRRIKIGNPYEQARSLENKQLSSIAPGIMIVDLYRSGIRPAYVKTANYTVDIFLI